ncbi:hypothetical protein BKA70DRAFT_1233669 [Coprinopsis sp. MPI-PUGE-AT-0042]|nr:hypothetical protein BKA70DRAFT_1233669 [Coprinopsis sp. MPI-PUGE-AT-0042]
MIWEPFSCSKQGRFASEGGFPNRTDFKQRPTCYYPSLSPPAHLTEAEDFVSPTQIGFSGGSWVQQAARGRSQSHRDNEGSPSGGQQSLPSTFELFSTAANPSFGRFLHPDTNDLPSWISDIPLMANQNDRLPSPRPEPSYGSTQGIEGLATPQWDIFSDTSTRDNRPVKSQSTLAALAEASRLDRLPSEADLLVTQPTLVALAKTTLNPDTTLRKSHRCCADGPSASTSSGRRINPLIGGLLGHSGCSSDRSANTSRSPSASNIISYPPSTPIRLKTIKSSHLLGLVSESKGWSGNASTQRILHCDNGEPGAITLQAFHPGNDPISEWVNYSMIGPHNPHTCTVLMNGMCCFSNCPSLQWYTMGAHVPSDAALHSDPDPFTRRYDVHDILPLKPPGFSD